MADIQTLINAIPDAQDGSVIDASYHNTIKTALKAIAGQLGGGGGESGSLTLQPTFLPIAPNLQWLGSLGGATDAGPGVTDGYVPLNLPNGAVIQELVVIGGKTNAAPKAFANLLVLPIGAGAGNSTTLIQIDFTNAGNPFTVRGSPSTSNIPGITSSGLLQIQTVNNSQFKYAVEVKVVSTAGTPIASVTVNAMQVNYTAS
jgi:hypothetical protein